LSEDSVFKTLIALPAPTVFQPTANNGNETDHDMYGALDLDGNLLLPFDFSGQVDKTHASVGTLLHGFSMMNAEANSPPGIPASLRARIAMQGDRDTRVRVFTPDGKPLPPLRKVTDDGDLFGLVDADLSLIRIQRADAYFGSAGYHPLFDFSDKVTAPG